MATIQDLQDKIDEILVPGQAIVMDLGQLPGQQRDPLLHQDLRSESPPGRAAEHDFHGSPHIGLRDAGVEAWMFDGTDSRRIRLKHRAAKPCRTRAARGNDVLIEARTPTSPAAVLASA